MPGTDSRTCTGEATRVACDGRSITSPARGPRLEEGGGGGGGGGDDADSLHEASCTTAAAINHKNAADMSRRRPTQQHYATAERVR